ncbi:MAG: hypothetical protein KJ614_00005 [Gammaproteobacteria bacterium]|uniref:hypothetical protein n=1 Tax=Rhodoferax sp. TaxID=50421 RepID=UPI001DD5B0C4|nr:hypothetical protein [Rhodoferax sp.]MBU3897308.1 hypothetical protein [Gammaproteobacteria bacterium]MBU3996369.1 hypothetical protein [Gammaproteobacteria bacterium]MBU4018653.1 hypothetical protein [Gammaproteobacteria bacterium]MBU4079609.1 hypothetical protein [Gammaproteobacteria bacterium]MBU4169565.1 hypothetical protein [Gammaproteobacteria bacterium]
MFDHGALSGPPSPEAVLPALFATFGSCLAASPDFPEISEINQLRIPRMDQLLLLTLSDDPQAHGVTGLEEENVRWLLPRPTPGGVPVLMMPAPNRR